MTARGEANPASGEGNPASGEGNPASGEGKAASGEGNAASVEGKAASGEGNAASTVQYAILKVEYIGGLFGVCCVLLVAIAIATCMTVQSNGETATAESCTAACINSAVRQNLTAEFPSQPDTTWHAIAACLKRQFVLTPRPPVTPCVLMIAYDLAGEKQAVGLSRTLNRLLDRLSHLIGDCGCSGPPGCQEFKVAAGGEQVPTMRQLLDEKAGDAAGSGIRCLVVPRVEKLSGDAMCSFYRLADSSDAPHRPFVYALTVETGTNGAETAAESSVRSHLRSAWLNTGMPAEWFDPLWAQIGNNVIILATEKDTESGTGTGTSD